MDHAKSRKSTQIINHENRTYTTRKLILVCVVVLFLVVTVISIGRYAYFNWVPVVTYAGADKEFLDNNQLLRSKWDKVSKLNRIEYPVYYINLDRSPERQKHIEREFDRYGIGNFHRISGVDGKKLENLVSGTTPNGFNFSNKATGLTSSELGCTLSHLIAIITAYQNNLENVLIVEDDVSFTLMPFWHASLPEICAKAPEDAQILHFYQFLQVYDVAHPFIPYQRDSSGAVSYLVNRKGMEQIISKCFNLSTNTIIIDPPTTGQADVYLYDIAKTYSYTVPLFYTDNGAEEMISTIHPEHSLPHFARSNEIIGYYINPPTYITLHGANYFTNFLSKLFPRMKHIPKYKTNDPKCVVVFGNVGNMLKQQDIDSYAKQFKIVIDAEPHDLSSITGIDLLLSTKTDSSLLPKNTPTIYVPFWLCSLSESNTNITDLIVSDFHQNRLQNKRRKFCAFLYSNCDEQYEGVLFRKQLLDKLQSRSGSKVDILGKCYNPNYIENGTHLNAKNIYDDYKFVISVENKFISGYISEKMTNPLLNVHSEASSAIPIYMGANDVGKYFNLNRIIHARDFPSIDDCIDHIMKIDQSDEEYNRIINEPVFINNIIPSQFTWKSILDSLQSFLPPFLLTDFVKKIEM